MRAIRSRVKRPNSPTRGITLHYPELYRNLELRRSRRRVVLGLEKKMARMRSPGRSVAPKLLRINALDGAFYLKNWRS